MRVTLKAESHRIEDKCSGDGLTDSDKPPPEWRRVVLRSVEIQPAFQGLTLL